MSVKILLPERERIYFCTFTCYKWIPLFRITAFYEELYKWLGILHQKGILTIGFVFMPNHVHCMLYVPVNSHTINRIIGTGKRFMAYEIIKRLTQIGRHDLLETVAKGVRAADRRRNKKHQVFEPTNDIKDCYNEDIVLQKLQYMHMNPVSGKWQLVDDYLNYPHSSARFYEMGESHEEIEITHFRDVGSAESPN